MSVKNICFEFPQRPHFDHLLRVSPSPTVLFPPPCQNPAGGLSAASVFRNVSATTVMRCEGRQKCSLHLRISTHLQLTGLFSFQVLKQAFECHSCHTCGMGTAKVPGLVHKELNLIRPKRTVGCAQSRY